MSLDMRLSFWNILESKAFVTPIDKEYLSTLEMDMSGI
jgi:hypothetical protein